MARFYEQGVKVELSEQFFWVEIDCATQGKRRVVVSKEVFNAILELQREHWRLEKRESRHTWHFEMMSEHDLARAQKSKDPGQILVEAYERAAIVRAILRIPEIQRRRFLLHYLHNLTLEQIAESEGCSHRAISYSLTLAKRNLRELLLEDFDF